MNALIVWGHRKWNQIKKKKRPNFTHFSSLIHWLTFATTNSLSWWRWLLSVRAASRDWHKVSSCGCREIKAYDGLLEHTLSGILIIVCTTCKESSHFSPLLQIIRVSLYMLLIDSICWKECLNFSHALHLPVYYNIHYSTSRGCFNWNQIYFIKMEPL